MAAQRRSRGGVSHQSRASRTTFFSIIIMMSAMLAGCGGGSASTGSPPPPGSNPGSVSFSQNAVSFNAAAPFAQAPANQTITGTVAGVTSGTVYVTIQLNNPNSFFTVSNPTITGNTGLLGLIPATPASLHPGSFSGSMTISVCLNDPTCKTGQLTGSPQTVSVTYNIGSGVDGNTVTPRVVPANAAGTAILRGAGFSGATNVSFGSVAASSISVASDSEIDASYPALAPGTYPVTINSGGISYSASLVAVAPPAFTQTLIPYPSGTGLPNPSEIEYDAQRTALFILLPGTNSPNPTLLRYAFDGNTGTWGSPTQISLAQLELVHVSPDGAHLLALVQNTSQASMVELDPVTLQQTNITNFSNIPDTCGFALANDGNAIVGRSSSPGFVFGSFSHGVTAMASSGMCPSIASGNGAIVAMDGANYVASTETVAQPGTTGTSADLAGDEFINGIAVQNRTSQVLGDLSTTFNVINWAGTRAYGYTADAVTCAPILTTFDLTAPPSGSPNPLFPVMGTPITLPNSCLNSTNVGYLLAISPDSGTVFIARPDGVVVQPVP